MLRRKLALLQKQKAQDPRAAFWHGTVTGATSMQYFSALRNDEVMQEGGMN